MTSSVKKKLLVVDVAALGWSLVRKHGDLAADWAFRPAQPVFPAVTCVAQASFRTASPPHAHGVVSNGLFVGDLRRILFWEQSAGLVAGRRIWQPARDAGQRVGLLFWQQSLGESVDVLLSPKPVHKHHGGMIQDCYSQPAALYETLCGRLGRSFNLMHYWGPLASRKSSDWIVAATAAVMEDRGLAPDLLLSYIPHLDYDLQRFGPDSPKSFQSLEIVLGYLSNLRKAAEAAGYDWLFFGDYAIEPVTSGAVYPNRILRDAGLLEVRKVRGMAYPDFFASHAFAMADHQVAHVYAAEDAALEAARERLAAAAGVERVLDRRAQRDAGLDAARGGDLLLVAKPGAWFAYPWWTDPAEAPDYATHVDIHNKPGYDPCELFFGWPPPSISRDPDRVRGTHGRDGAGTEVAWATSLELERAPGSLIELAETVRNAMGPPGC